MTIFTFTFLIFYTHPYFILGFQSETLTQKLRQGYKEHGGEILPACKLSIFFGSYIKESYGMAPYAKASSLLASYTREYDKLLTEVDVLIMPTLHDLHTKIPEKKLSITELVESAALKPNASIFNVTGHPAITINCGYYKEFPIGISIVGKRFHEVDVLNVASIFEEAFKPVQKN